jgi:NhaA family Na+:H+ antiporter
VERSSALPDSFPGTAGRWLLRLPDRFLRLEAAGGVALLAAAFVSVIWANSAWFDSYRLVWTIPLLPAAWPLPSTPEFLINDGLMTAFFLLVGIEIQDERRDGVLADPRSAILPIAAALGGMAVPAVIYWSMSTSALVRRGWGIPTATDIAFSVGVLALLGKRVPPAMRILLLTLATVDDIGSVAILAIFYHAELSLPWVLIASSGVLVMLVLRRHGVASLWAYLAAGTATWWTALHAGVPPALAGLPCGLLVPMKKNTSLRSWVAYGVMPLFALANMGVRIRGLHFGDNDSRSVIIGVLLARLLGKPVGILLSSAALVRCGICALPPRVTWPGVGLIGCLAGIGFTVPIYVASVAFGDESLQAAARFALLAASAVAACVAMVAGRIMLPEARHLEDGASESMAT